MVFMDREQKRTIRLLYWALFSAFFLILPVPYYMVVVGGIVTTAWITYISVHGLLVAIPKFSAEGFWMLLILWAHIILFGGILFIAAFVLAWLMVLFFPRRTAFISVMVICALLIWASTFEIYRMPGHNSAPPGNIIRLYSGLFH